MRRHGPLTRINPTPFNDGLLTRRPTYPAMSTRSPQARAACPKGATQDEPLTAIRTNLTALSGRCPVPSRRRRAGAVADVYRPRRSPAFVWSSRPPTPPATGAPGELGRGLSGQSAEAKGNIGGNRQRNFFESVTSNICDSA